MIISVGNGFTITAYSIRSSISSDKMHTGLTYNSITSDITEEKGSLLGTDDGHCSKNMEYHWFYFIKPIGIKYFNYFETA